MTPVTEPILELSDATVVKDERRVLDGVNLTIREGDHTTIIGPNGAGKSILVSLLTLEQRPLAATNGTPPVRIFGRETGLDLVARQSFMERHFRLRSISPVGVRRHR